MLESMGRIVQDGTHSARYKKKERKRAREVDYQKRMKERYEGKKEPLPPIPSQSVLHKYIDYSAMRLKREMHCLSQLCFRSGKKSKLGNATLQRKLIGFKPVKAKP